MIRSRTVSLALVGLFLWQTGCVSYKQIGIGELSEHDKVRLTFTTGERETIRDPWFDGYNVRGQAEVEIASGAEVTQTVAFRPDSVSAIEAKSTNVPLTVVAVLGGLVVLAVGVLALACAVGEGNCQGYSCVC